jgi:prepilin-type N-terminal cleavage/methylation domain-containing protein
MRLIRVSKGFTLVELLVVISIIALLLSILMPSLGKARDQARDIVCKSNLKQWGLYINLYVNDYGRYPRGVHWWQKDYAWTAEDADGREMWEKALRQYHKDNFKVFCCPVAASKMVWKKSGGATGYRMGDPKVAWGYMPDAYWYLPGSYGSYSINNWVYGGGPGWQTVGDYVFAWGKPGYPNADNIPVFGDCIWADGQTVRNEDEWPQFEADLPNTSTGVWTNALKWWTLKRHGNKPKGINMLMMEGSVRQIKLPDLKTIKWHKGFNINPNSSTNDPYSSEKEIWITK